MTTIDKLHKHVEILNNQLEEKEKTIKDLRQEIEKFNYNKANQSWVEND